MWKCIVSKTLAVFNNFQWKYSEQIPFGDGRSEQGSSIVLVCRGHHILVVRRGNDFSRSATKDQCVRGYAWSPCEEVLWYFTNTVCNETCVLSSRIWKVTRFRPMLKNQVVRNRVDRDWYVSLDLIVQVLLNCSVKGFWQNVTEFWESTFAKLSKALQYDLQ